MSEQSNDMMAVLQRMQQQLMFLEKKLDTLIAQSRPSSQPFSRPFRPAFKRPDQGNGHSRGPSSHGPSRGPGHSSGGPGYKKPYFGRPKDR